MVTAPLSEQLRDRYKRRSLPIRKGDTVKILRGDFAGLEGKVIDINRVECRIFIEGVTRERVSGQQVKIGVHPSKVVVMNLDLGDRWRSDVVEMRAKVEAKPEAQEAR